MHLPRFLLLFFLCLQARAAETRRPNILFVFADDWGRYASAYRTVDGENSLNAVVKTPNFDRVAKEGVLFTRAYVNAPSCTPCRSALLSGQYFWRTGRGAILRGAQWDAAIPTYPLLLQKAGWHIGFSGKVWSPGTPADAPYGAPANRYMKAGMAISRYSEQMMAANDRDGKQRAIFAQVAENFSQFLADRKSGQPWCYWFGPTQTHRPVAPGSGKALWGIEPDMLKGKLPPFLPDNDVVRADISDYLGEAQSVDAALGALLKKLEETGELDNTLLMVSGDHGMPGVPRGKCNLYDFGTHVALAARWPGRIPPGRVVDDFVNLMDLAPTFLEAAGEKPLPVMTGRSFLNVLTSAQSGQVDPARSYVITGRERHVDTARPGNLPYPHRAIRTKDYSYIRNFAPDRWPMGAPFGAPLDPKDVGQNTFATFADMDASPTKAWLVQHGEEPENKKFREYAFAKRPGEELYDLRKDPHELSNLAADPALTEVKTKLAAQLMEVLQKTGDPRVTGDGSTYDKPPFTLVEADTAVFPLKVSNDRRHLVDATGKPFLVTGDTAWSLIAQLSLKDILKYVDDRQKRGFNAIIVNLIEHKFSDKPPAMKNGVLPFLKPGDFAQPNVAYFDFAHRAVAAANDRGIAVWLCPAYLGWGGGGEGFFAEIKAAGPAVLRSYGRYVGGKFKDLPNIVWMIGGDYALPESERWAGAELAAGLEEGGARQLITAHGGQTSAVETFGDQPWLAVDTVYRYVPDLYNPLREAWKRKPVRPFVLIETTYEGEHESTPEQIRRQAWWAMLSGACGQFFGSNPMWHFDGPGLFKTAAIWQQALDSTGSRDIARLGRILSREPWQKLVPDLENKLVTSGRGEGTSYITAAMTADHKVAILYIPSDGKQQREITLDLSVFPGFLDDFDWINPVNGPEIPTVGGGTPIPNRPGWKITTPGDNGTGTNDWVLVLRIFR